MSRYILPTAFAFLLACKTQSEFGAKASQTLTNSENDMVQINNVLNHENDSSSAVYLEILNENLLYKYTDTAQLPYARLKIAYELEHLGEKKNARKDTGSYLLYDRASEEVLSSKPIYSKFYLPSRFGNNYVLHLSVVDLNKRIQYNEEIFVQKKDRFNRQNFLVSRRGKIAFSPAFKSGDTLSVKFNSPLYYKAQVDHFKKAYPVAPPPFSTKNQPPAEPAADSNFVCVVNGGEMEIKMPAKGFYHIRLSEKSNEGLSLYTFPESFPGISNSEEMIQCTRYIMTKEEYTVCMEAENKKMAIDKFWLEIGGSNERAKELLKRYYARVKEANKMYSAYNEGWKSDRGMIFIVFGQPTTVMEKEDEEVWIYGSPVNQSTTTFVFKRIENPYSDNVCQLDRSQFYKGVWSNAVDIWRQGVYYEGRK